MSENPFDYRLIELKCYVGFDFPDNDEFREFYLKLKELCDEYNVHLSATNHMAKRMVYKVYKDGEC